MGVGEIVQNKPGRVCKILDGCWSPSRATPEYLVYYSSLLSFLPFLPYLIHLLVTYNPAPCFWAKWYYAKIFPEEHKAGGKMFKFKTMQLWWIYYRQQAVIMTMWVMPIWMINVRKHPTIMLRCLLRVACIIGNSMYPVKWYYIVSGINSHLRVTFYQQNMIEKSLHTFNKPSGKLS